MPVHDELRLRFHCALLAKVMLEEWPMQAALGRVILGTLQLILRSIISALPACVISAVYLGHSFGLASVTAGKSHSDVTHHLKMLHNARMARSVTLLRSGSIPD